MKDYLKRLDPLSRRKFMMNTAKTALGVSMVPGLDRILAQGSAAGGGKAEYCIFLYMSGGMTHMETFDPKPGTETGGPTKTVKTPVAGVHLAEYLPGLAERMNDIAVVRSMSQKTGDHRGGSYWMHTSYAPRATIVHPTMGPWAQTILGKRNKSLPDSVAIGVGGEHPGAGFFGPALAPLPVGNPESGVQNSKLPEGVDERAFEDRMELISRFDQSFTRKFQTDEVRAYTQFYEETMKLLSSSELDAFDISKEPQEKRQKYGMNSFGQGCLLARRLVQNNIRFIEVNFGGWDMHNDLWTAIQDRAGTLDQAVSALIDDLKAEGLFDKTLIALGTEFGRTPKINANGGRDHHPRAFSAMFAGGGIQGGQVYGKSDDRGIAVEENPVDPKDFNATIAYAMGIPLEKVVFAPSGRPFLVAGHVQDPETKEIKTEGKPIMPFFS